MGGLVVMPTIRVDDEVFKVLQGMATPFVDTPNSVLRRVLGLDSVEAPGSQGLLSGPSTPPNPAIPAQDIRFAGPTKDLKAVDNQPVPPPRRTSRGGRPSIPDATPKEDYWLPILRILVQAGGREDVSTVLDLLEDEINLLPGDLASIQSGELRWRNRAKWARKDMALNGLIESNSPRGVWEITERGRQFLREQDDAPKQP
jgi:hypothetical protein